MVHIASVAALYTALVGVSRVPIQAQPKITPPVLFMLGSWVPRWYISSSARETFAKDAEVASGQMNSAQCPELGYTPCENGFAAAIPEGVNNIFRCNNVSYSDIFSMNFLNSCRLTCTTFCRTQTLVALKAKAHPPGAGHPTTGDSSSLAANLTALLSQRSAAKAN